MNLRYVFGLILLTLLSSPAHARKHHHSYAAATYSTAAHPGCNVFMPCEGVVRSPRGERVVRAMGGLGVAIPHYVRPAPAPARRVQTTHHRARHTTVATARYRAPIDSSQRRVEVQIVAHPAGCPRTAFCGCGAAVRVFGSPVRSLWLAANWFQYPRAAPAPGMVAVRSHHVFVIEQILGNGLVVAYDANSGGHATRIHAVSLAGYTIVNPHGRG